MLRKYQNQSTNNIIRGFTLIELLAVIVILAIIALIAVPIIMNVINTSKKGAAEDSAYGIIKSSETYYGEILIDNKNLIDDEIIFDCSKKVEDKVCMIDDNFGLTFKGTKPTKGTVTITKDGKIRIKNLFIDRYVCNHVNDTNKIACRKIAVGKSFADDSWKTIIEAIRDGDASAYKVGDTKKVDMGSLGIHTLRIANISTPSECNNSSFSQTACGFVLEFADIVTSKYMNSATKAGGWPVSWLRGYLNGTIYKALPEDLRNEILETTVITGHALNAKNYVTKDRIYLLSTAEVWSGGHKYDAGRYVTRQLDYYKGVTLSSYSKASKKSDWWLRNSDSGSSYYFYIVKSNGSWNEYQSGYSGVSPAFRIN